MEFLHGTSSKMPGVGDVRTESRRAQVICSTPKRSKTVRRSRLSRISRSSLRFSGPRSPGISPVSLTASYARDDFSDIDDFEEASFHKENLQRPTRIHGNISSGKMQHENFQSRVCDVEMKRGVPRWGVSQTQRKVQYEPLVIVSDEEEFTGIGKRGLTRKNQVKKHAGIASTVYRNSVRGSDSESESLDSGKGTSEAQVSIPVAMSSGPRVLEDVSHPRANFSTHKNIGQRKTSVCQISKYDSGMEEIQALPKESVLDLITSVQWKSGRACYEPLVIALSDEEDNNVVKKKKRTCKMPTKLINANSRNSGGGRRPKKIVVNASFDDYEDDREEDTEEDSVQNMSLNGTEDEYLDSIHREEEELIGQAYSSGDESYQSVRSHEAVRRRKASSSSSLDNAEDILNESFCSDDEDEVLSGSAIFNRKDHARERQKLSYDQERHESVVCKPSCRVSSYGYGDEEEDKFEDDSADFGTEYDLSGPCGDSSGRIFAMQKGMSGVGEMQYRMNTSGPRNSFSYKLHSEGVVQNSKRQAVKGKPGRRKVLQSPQTDSEENGAKDSGKKPRKALQKKKSLQADDKESCVKRKVGRPSSVKTGEGVPKPSRKPGRKRKLESQESSDSTSNNKTSDIEAPPTVKKTNKRINKSVAQSDTIANKKPNARKRKSDDCDPSTRCIQETKKRRQAPKAGKSKKETSESTDSSLEKGSKDAVKRKRGRPPSKGKEQKGKDSNQENLGNDARKDVDAEEKSTQCEDLAGKRKSLHNPNASQGLTLNNEESSSSTKDDSQNVFPLTPRLVRKRSAESSSDYLRKKVLTMRLGKSICNQSLMENEEQLFTSTPVKPSSSRISTSSSAKMPDAETVFFGNAGKGESQPAVNELLERINEETEEDSKKNSAVKIVEEIKGNETNEEQKNKDETEKTASNIKESPSEEKENAQTLSVKKPKSPSKPSEKFVVDKILSEWPVEEICASSNEKLKQALSKPNKVKAVVNGREQEIETFVEFSQIKFHKHKKQNIQYGPAVNTPTYGSGLVHLTPGSDKGVSVAKQCNFIYVVLGGLVEVKLFNVSERLCKPGDFIVIPKGTKYNITGRGDKVSALIYFKCQGAEII